MRRALRQRSGRRQSKMKKAKARPRLRSLEKLQRLD